MKAADNITSPQTTDPSVADQLLPLLYNELRRLARSRMARLAPGQTLDPTDLVHEAYLRIAGKSGTGFEGRRHFFFAASRAMRDVLVERARKKASLKRGGHHWRVELKDAVAPASSPRDFIDLCQALDKLQEAHPDQARAVELRYFCGLTLEETADITGWSVATVKRRWNYARVWLKRELLDSSSPSSGNG